MSKAPALSAIACPGGLPARPFALSTALHRSRAVLWTDSGPGLPGGHLADWKRQTYSTRREEHPEQEWQEAAAEEPTRQVDLAVHYTCEDRISSVREVQ
jgi:hypothetical protein